MRFRLLLSLFALAAVVGPPAASAVAAHPLRASAGTRSALATQVVAELNATRTARGLVPLRVSPALAAAAAVHSREMAEKGYFAHRSPDGSDFSKRVTRYYLPSGARTWSVGENLLWSSPTIDASGAIRMWLGSPGHRRNMLDPQWREVGISALHVDAAPGFYRGLEVTIVTADFGVRR